MKQYRIAVVGSGIAGLTAAWLLSKKHHVTILEKGSSLGMAQFGVNAQTAAGESVVDVPLRVFNKSYYPNLFRMCQELDVDLRFVDHGGSFGYINGDLYFKYKNLSIGSRNYSYVLPKLSQLPWLFSVGREILKLKKDMASFLKEGNCDEVTLKDFFDRYKYSRSLQYEFFLPILSSVCTCSYSALLEYPAGIVVEGMYTLMETTPTQRFVGGTRALQAGLADAVQEVRYNSHVRTVSPVGDAVSIQFEDGEQREFDHVILATQANQAFNMLDESYSQERQLLSEIPYQSSDMIVHRDHRLMPRQSGKWAPVYYGINEEDWPMATIWINEVEPGFEGGELLFQTWNPLIEPDPKKLLGKTTFERPVVTQKSLKAVHQLTDIQKQSPDQRKIWLCGSYATRAIPLLESGLVSAVSISEQFGVEAPEWFVKGSAVLDQLRKPT